MGLSVCSLPATPSEAVPPDPAAAPLILLVDDEEGVLRSLSRFLRREGFRVDTCRSGDLALEALAGGVAPMVVISDYRMPGTDGVSFLSRVRDRWPRVQRILMTGFADMQALEAAINDSQIYRFLGKPWDDAGLVATVRSAVEQWELETENCRLQALTQEQNRQLGAANRDLEKKVEERTALLSRAKREWEVAFDAISEPLMIIDRDHRIVRGNLAIAAHFGVDVRTITGARCHDLRAASASGLPREADGVCQRCPVKQARASGVAWATELATADERLYSLGVFPISGDERGAMVCRYQDLTEQRARSRQLAQADKLSAMGLLAGGVAHEINNPLGAILAFAQLLRREEVDGEEQKDYLKEIEDSAVRCKQIVERLLRFARQGKREDRKSFSVNDVVADAMFLVEKSYLQKGVVLARQLAPDVWPVVGNANEVAQVLLNLITNARDAMDARGGMIKVTTRNLPEEGAVLLAVADTGGGIPPEVLKRIFDPFFTTKPEGKGTGLGLAVSYGIIRDHHGRIDVRSRVGEGTEFEVVLPRAPA